MGRPPAWRLTPHQVLCGLLCQEALTQKSMFCWTKGDCSGREIQVLGLVVYPPDLSFSGGACAQKAAMEASRLAFEGQAVRQQELNAVQKDAKAQLGRAKKEATKAANQLAEAERKLETACGTLEQLEAQAAASTEVYAYPSWRVVYKVVWLIPSSDRDNKGDCLSVCYMSVRSGMRICVASL